MNLLLENVGIDTIFIALACSIPPILGKKRISGNGRLN